jgi:formate dehydrogenase maturation protein FdhE
VEQDDEIIGLLKQIEHNQSRALEAQEKHLSLAQAQLDRSNQQIKESLDLQRVSVGRQTQIRNVAMPLIAVLIVLLVYLLFKLRVF